jgi:uncharacterized membrane protein
MIGVVRWPQHRSRREAALPLVTAGLTVVVTALYLLHGGRSYTFDESVSIARFISTGSPRVALTEQYVFNNHPLFSVGQTLLWRAGGDTEAWQRVLPVFYGAGTVAALTWTIGRRLGLVAGVTAGAIVATNPVFAEQARLVRGYSLATFAVVVAGISIVSYLRGGSRWWLVAHGVGAAVAVGTHLYAGVALAALGFGAIAWWLASRRRPDVAVVSTWLLAAVAAILVYAPTWHYLRQMSEERGKVFHPSFPADAASAVLGDSPVAIVALAVLGALAIVALASDGLASPPAAAAVGGIAAAVAALTMVWLVVQPFDLYPRFLVVLVPMVAVGAAIAVARWPSLAVVVAVAVVAMAVTSSTSWFSEAPNREAAKLLASARDRGLAPCVLGGAALAAYERNLPEVHGPSDLAACDVFVRVGSWGGPELTQAARAAFDHRWRIRDRYPVFSRVPRSVLEPAP